MVPTPIVSAVVWPSPTWATQRMLPTPIPIHHQMPPPSCPTLQQPPQPITIQQQQQQQPPPQPPAPMCPTVVHRPIRIQESNVGKPIQTSSHHHKSSTTNAPTYQRQSKVTQDHQQQRRKSQGVDYNNLILLTKSAMKVRRCQTKGSKKFFGDTKTTGSKSDGSSTRWLDKGLQPVIYALD